MENALAPCLRALCAAATILAAPAQAADGDAPSSAGDVSGNAKSFFNNLGKGVTTPQPYQQQKVWAAGNVQGIGYVCIEGIARPQPQTPGRVIVNPITLSDCDKLVADGVLRRVATAATQGAESAAGTRAAGGGIEVCRGFPYPASPERNAAGIQETVCTNLRGEPVRVLNLKTNQYRELTDADRAALRTAGRNSGALTPPPGNWDKVDALVAQSKARADADAKAASERAQAAQRREAALRQCRTQALSGTGAQDLRTCMAEADKAAAAPR